MNGQMTVREKRGGGVRGDEVLGIWRIGELAGINFLFSFFLFAGGKEKGKRVFEVEVEVEIGKERG